MLCLRKCLRRPILLLAIALTGIVCFLIYRINHILEVRAYFANTVESVGATLSDIASKTTHADRASEFDALIEKLTTPLHSGAELSGATREEGLRAYARFMDQPIDEPKGTPLVRPGTDAAGKAPATILCLVRNKDLEGIRSSITELEKAFNGKFKYPYTFLNDEPFTPEFKEAIQKLIPEHESEFATIDKEFWSIPEAINREKYDVQKLKLLTLKVGHAEEDSYHLMCRFYSRYFYKVPELAKYRYVWRLEPNVNFHSELNYDVFQFMKAANKIYGFTISLYDNPWSVESLWDHTMDFVRAHPHYLNQAGATDWLRENIQKSENFKITRGYSTCHFWSNFEIIDLEFLRSEAYEQFVEYLDQTGGFFYERWGDAPVRSLALALFANASDIHWFRDIAYNHLPYFNCPTFLPDSRRSFGTCKSGKFSNWDELNVENCAGNWILHAMTDADRAAY
ncbi:AEL243Wp [Eremothecium gossypii ATCC 10895]|uniref:AEL243Wp n=1 Tax=Eremothecium gossypii (strain ATCC 10895 / CBS 109.51 / FGSC 9923 / NRRL Y-1056) TaxID=284811 RepID=Q758K5_EREGS|nr:AEL243Wp [Eremothecium gossypii ATCC 10895]AAS52442.1 AEL243Wp [Eremothecium gossypii ATCC 10895]